MCICHISLLFKITTRPIFNRFTKFVVWVEALKQGPSDRLHETFTMHRLGGENGTCAKPIYLHKWLQKSPATLYNVIFFVASDGPWRELSIEPKTFWFVTYLGAVDGGRSTTGAV